MCARDANALTILICRYSCGHFCQCTCVFSLKRSTLFSVVTHLVVEDI